MGGGGPFSFFPLRLNCDDKEGNGNSNNHSKSANRNPSNPLEPKTVCKSQERSIPPRTEKRACIRDISAPELEFKMTSNPGTIVPISNDPMNHHLLEREEVSPDYIQEKEYFSHACICGAAIPKYEGKGKSATPFFV